MAEEMGEDNEPEIGPRGGERTRRHLCTAAPDQHGICIEEDERRQDEEEKELESHKLTQQLLAGHAVSLAQPDRQHRRVPCTDENAKRPEQHHQRKRERQPRHGVLTTAMANVETVHHSVERVQAHRHKRGPRIPEKQSSQRSRRQLARPFCRNLPSHADASLSDSNRWPGE